MKNRNTGGGPITSSFIMDEDGENQNKEGDDKSSDSRIKRKKKGDSIKKRMA